MSNENYLEVQGLKMHFKRGEDVLAGVDLSLAAGSVTGLLGKNGAGKTTLMRIALGLLQADTGEVKIFGESAWQASSQARSRIGYVPQTDVAFNWMKVHDALNLVGSFYEQWDTALLDRYIKEWDVDSTAYIEDLSRGQRQKVAILMAIGHGPDLLILDEPVASLDPGARRQFLQAIVELNQDLNRSILFSTHITSDLERVAADVAVLHGGRLTFQGDLDQLKEQCQKLYFKGDSLPANMQVEGIENYTCQGNQASAFARNWSQDQTLALAQSLGVNVVAESLPLEELFLELTHE